MSAEGVSLSGDGDAVAEGGWLGAVAYAGDAGEAWAAGGTCGKSIPQLLATC